MTVRCLYILSTCSLTLGGGVGSRGTAEPASHHLPLIVSFFDTALIRIGGCCLLGLQTLATGAGQFLLVSFQSSLYLYIRWRYLESLRGADFFFTTFFSGCGSALHS